MKRRLLVNEDEPRTGDDGFTFYDNSHPLHGNRDTVDRMRGALKGLRGETITVTISGIRQDSSGASRRWSARRTIRLNTYSDIFGPGGALLSALKAQMKKNSPDKLVVQAVTVEDDTGEPDDEDEE